MTPVALRSRHILICAIRSGANLFRVDFALIKGNDGTNFDGANMKFIRFVDRSEKTDG